MTSKEIFHCKENVVIGRELSMGRWREKSFFLPFLKFASERSDSVPVIKVDRARHKGELFRRVLFT